MNNMNFLNTIKPITYYDCISTYSHKLNISNKYQKIIVNIAETADKLGILACNTPPSIAVCCIYMFITALNIDITKKDIMKSSGISEVTISKMYKKLYPYRRFLFTMKVTK